MTVELLLQHIHDEWSAFQAAVAAVEQDRLDEAGVAGEWSIKDIVAHVTWFEDEIADLVETRSLVGSDWWQLHPDERNRRIYEANTDRGVVEVFEDAKGAHERLVAAIGTLQDEALGDPSAFAHMPSEWVPSAIIAQNSYEHYPDHAKAVSA